MHRLHTAPEWAISHWLNTPEPITLSTLRGRVVLAVAFQMLCPGCVSRALPQLMRARAAFSEHDLSVIGLHTVFEHHEAQGSPQALAAFLHEYRIDVPVGIDAQVAGLGPQTMRAYRMQGTPTTPLIDRGGVLRSQTFGHLEDIVLGASLQALIGEQAFTPVGAGAPADPLCTDEGCSLPSEQR